MLNRKVVLAFLAGAVFVGAPMALIAQNAAKAPPKAIVSLYHIAPGKHVEFLKWQAAREAARKDANVGGAGQWYVHLDGDSWDFLSISPVATEAEDAAIDAAAKKKGLKTGAAAGIELRKTVASHTDTFVMGPMPIEVLLKEASK